MAGNATASPDLASQVSLIAYCYVLPVVCALGIVGNITNLITLASRRLRAVSYMLVSSLSLIPIGTSEHLL